MIVQPRARAGDGPGDHGLQLETSRKHNGQEEPESLRPWHHRLLIRVIILLHDHSPCPAGSRPIWKQRRWAGLSTGRASRSWKPSVHHRHDRISIFKFIERLMVKKAISAWPATGSAWRAAGDGSGKAAGKSCWPSRDKHWHVLTAGGKTPYAGATPGPAAAHTQARFPLEPGT